MPSTPRVAFNAARIYAESAAAAVASEQDPRTAALVATRFQDRAVALALLSIERQPSDRRLAFWRDHVQTDPALRGVRRRIKSPTPATP